MRKGRTDEEDWDRCERMMRRRGRKKSREREREREREGNNGKKAKKLGRSFSVKEREEKQHVNTS